MASKVTVRLAVVDGNLIFEIVDNGVGFDFNNCGRPDSYGLIGMNELITMLGGIFKINSAIGKGTIVRVEMPYND
jgi:signal transduction histidine kinase